MGGHTLEGGGAGGGGGGGLSSPKSPAKLGTNNPHAHSPTFHKNMLLPKIERADSPTVTKGRMPVRNIFAEKQITAFKPTTQKSKEASNRLKGSLQVFVLLY
jgi:hypothetical protein